MSAWFDPADLAGARLLYAGFRVAWVGLGVLLLVLLRRRLRPGAAVAVLAALQVVAWAAYVAPLGRPYGSTSLDRVINMGEAACTAAGHSPLDSVQVGYTGLEPLWSVLVAALSLFQPARVLGTYGVLSPLVLVFVAAAIYRGLRGEDEDARWDAAFACLAALGLSSLSAANTTDLPPAWIGSFLHKPNHAAGWGVAALVLGARAREAAWWRLGLLLALLGWVFVVHWGFVVAALALGALLRPAGRRALPALAGAVALSAVLIAPLVLNLTRDFNPAGGGDSPQQVWGPGEAGARVVLPHAWLLEPGLLSVAALGGAILLARRGRALDREVLALGATMAAAALVMGLSGPFGLAPEPDDVHFFVRFAFSLCAGLGLGALAREAASRRAPAVAGTTPALALAALLPLCLPAWWDPPSMDRYFRTDLQPPPANVLALGAWVRAHTPRDAVFSGSATTVRWIPALTGRRVLLLGDKRPPRDYEARRLAEEALLTSPDPALVAKAAAAFGITHLLVDPAWREAYPPPLPASSALRPVARFQGLTLYEVDGGRAGR